LDEDPHGAVCGACHNPHTQDIPGAAVDTCIGCHEGADTITVFHTGTHAPAFPECTSCHTAHRWTVDGTDCLSCHESIMEEPRSAWNGSGGPPVASTRTASFPPLLMIHGVGNLRPSPHLEPGQTGTAADTLPRPLLHRQHEAIACTECHGRAGEHGVVTVRTPRECAQCHHDPARGYDCADCHSRTLAPTRRWSRP
jgi:hypothetical protein